MATRTRHLAPHDLLPGMVLAQPLTLVEHGFVTYNLPAAHVLTQENLHQLASHHAVCVQIEQDDPRTDAQREADTQRQAGRLQMIFRHADLAAPESQALFQALLAHRSA
jgi:hypothetical protein